MFPCSDSIIAEVRSVYNILRFVLGGDFDEGFSSKELPSHTSEKSLLPMLQDGIVNGRRV
jgi:hypothetical protein